MTAAKEQALYLFNTFYHEIEEIAPYSARKAAIICVDQLMKLNYDDDSQIKSYWNDVREELIKLTA